MRAKRLRALQSRVMLKYWSPKINLFGTTREPEADMDWTTMRRARPFNQLLPGTQRWAASLPDVARPIELMRTYPGIANRIASAWRNPEAAHDVLDDLLVDRRGGRRGFPPFEHAELLRLQEALPRGR